MLLKGTVECFLKPTAKSTVVPLHYNQTLLSHLFSTSLLTVTASMRFLKGNSAINTFLDTQLRVTSDTNFQFDAKCSCSKLKKLNNEYFSF